MTNPTDREKDRWNDVIVPTAKALESFFWKLAWFIVFLMLLFGGPCIHRFVNQ